ncbi:YjiH family protein [Endozoicomonas sp. SCSIO W0465]|uniref:YjiH family protein n=1 Tax=Endozoicomonas sp. SCSIO W0465 TaxID=2918516 RepID=UPI002076020F|nr:YjiH family protein [Endozoicomonas sp. SCSIO W0465]USE33828.1 YjiH family protein [Endozoicomonas sp. SCSIO W0465]
MKQFPAVKKRQVSLRNWLTFLIPSLIGLLLFVTPVSINGEFTIPVALLAGWLKALLNDQLTTIITVIISFTGVMTIVTKLFQPPSILKHPFLSSLFDITPLWCVVRVAGMVFVLASFFKVGPQALWSGATGGMVLNDLMPTLFSVFIFAGLLLPLLMNFGLLELLGTLMTRIMRPVFNLPGRSAIDCIASWLGDGSVGILMTSKQYETSYYTQREAAVIGTTFSVVSITFSLVVIAQVGLDHLFTQFYLTVCFAGLVAAIIVPKLPPLSRKKDVFICGKTRSDDDEIIPPGTSAFAWGLQQALEKAAKITNPVKVIQDGGKNAIDMVFAVLPVVMGIGTIALMITEYTPVFQYLGMPFLPLLEWLQIPEAQAASTTMMVGFTDMFVPSILAASIDNDMTRFVIAALSLTQLIYLSEVGALLLGSKIPVTLFELFIIFILRTLVTLPVIAAIAHLIF